MDDILLWLDSCMGRSEVQRVGVYNTLVSALADLVADFAPDPALRPQLVPIGEVEGNAYNPNRVASVEMDLLETSIRADGLTMAVVTMKAAADRWEVVDGFHRRIVMGDRLGRRWIPVVELRRPLVDRMASTVRHNRARGKHHVDLMADLVKGMMELGWDDARIAAALGMSEEELLRLRQMVGAAKMLAAREYSQSWGTIEKSAGGDE